MNEIKISYHIWLVNCFLINKNRIYQNLVFKNTELSEEKYENKGLIIDLIIPLILKWIILIIQIKWLRIIMASNYIYQSRQGS